MSKQYIMLLISLTLLLTGCQGEVSEGVDGSSETIFNTAMSADGATAPVEEEKVIYFKGYGDKENPVPLSAATANITLYGKKDAENLALLTQLKELKLNGSSSYPITNLEMVKSLSNLEVLYVADEDITDISALAELKNLKNLNLRKYYEAEREETKKMRTADIMSTVTTHFSCPGDN